MPNQIAELNLVVKSDDVAKGSKRLKELGKTGSRTEEQLERLDFIIGALNRNLLDSAKKTNRLQREQIKATRTARNASDANAKLAKSTKGVTLSQIRNLAALGGLTFAMVRYSQAVISADKANTRIKNSLRFVTGNAKEMKREFDFIVRTSDKYGQDVRTLAREYTKFAAAAQKSSIAGKESRLVLEGMAAASATLGLESEQMKGAMKALEQILSKGTLSAEEIRQQLAERLPGAFRLAAESIGVTTEELTDMIAQGKIGAEEWLPAFSRQLLKTFGGGIDKKTDNLTAAINRLNNEIFLMFTDENNRLANSFKDIVVQMTEVLKDPEFRSGVISLNNLMGTMIKGGGFAVGAIGNLPKNVALSVKGFETSMRIDALNKALADTTDPARIEELKQGILDAENALLDAFKALEPGTFGPARLGVVAPDTALSGAGKPDIPGISAKRHGEIRDRGFGILQDPKSRLQQLDEQHREEREFLKENWRLILDSKADFHERLFYLDQSYAEKRKGLNEEIALLEQKGFRKKLSATADYFNDLELLSQGSSKEIFAISKGLALAEAAINAPKAISAAYANGTTIGGPFLGVVYATLAGVHQAMQIAAIESQSFSGNRANGGFLNGPHATGDRTTFNGNRGEVVLNGQQQANFMDMANGRGSRGGGPRQLKIVNNLGVEATAESSVNAQGDETVILRKVKREIMGELTNGVSERTGAFNRAMEGRFRTRTV